MNDNEWQHENEDECASVDYVDDDDDDNDDDDEEDIIVELDIDDCLSEEEDYSIYDNDDDHENTLNVHTDVNKLVKVVPSSSQFYTILTEKQVLLEQQSQLQSVLDMLQLDTSYKNEYQKQILYDTMYTILKAYQWKTEKLFHDYLEFGEQYILQISGINSTTEGKSNSTILLDIIQSSVNMFLDFQTRSDSKDGSFCAICMDDDKSLVHIGTCNHEFCHDCWYSYISVRVTESTSDSFIPCMNPSCYSMLSQSFIYHMLATKATNCHIAYSTFQAYLRKRIDGYVRDNPLFRWCSSTPFCGHAVKITDNYQLTDCLKVKCICGKVMCFKCGKRPHDPATCDMVERWENKVQEESASVTYVKYNTTQCPKCKVPVEKSGGCSHMRCTACGHAYCWECLSPLLNHSFCYQKKLRLNHSELDLENLQKELRIIATYFEYIEKYKIHSQWIDEEESTGCHSSKLRNVVDDDDMEWVHRTFDDLTHLKLYFINCCIFAFHVFEMEDLEAELKVEETLKKLSRNASSVINRKPSSARKKSNKNRIRKMKHEMTQQLEKKKKNTAIYEGLFLNLLEQLDNHLQSIMLLLNDMYQLESRDKNNNNSKTFLSMKQEVDLLLSLAKTTEIGLGEVISEKEMREFDR